MPVTRSAKKKLKQDKKRQKSNKTVKNAVAQSIKQYRKKPTEKLLSKTYSLLDRALKKNLIHKNKVARLKSALAKLGPSKPKAKIAPAKKKK
ncbi:hypothetical protein A2W14_00955 [Candidatus Gottesmanbacteria bacterium RBG_16_37_8]|uniref:Small ribosomal subunit protein bS20 n=1 Tax=Candidatus Gottesmanbacteria bacterium RBG_16_37_8 TaxID=1798371 RepID=A0A1F5YQ07_9BACT|nr:MAG: hypothetical protein A2W14_00955 [Candidatus Gottesmanbacteria bacterium RBG_16_37_8]